MAFSHSTSFSNFHCGICGHSVISRSPLKCQVCGTLLCTECFHHGLCSLHFDQLNEEDQALAKELDAQKKSRQRNRRGRCIPCLILPFIFIGGRIPLGWLFFASFLVLSIIISLYFSRNSRIQEEDAIYTMEWEKILQKYHFQPNMEKNIPNSTHTTTKITSIYETNSKINLPNKICPNCGAENSSDYRICHVCGNIFG